MKVRAMFGWSLLFALIVSACGDGNTGNDAGDTGAVVGTPTAVTELAPATTPTEAVDDTATVEATEESAATPAVDLTPTAEMTGTELMTGTEMMPGTEMTDTELLTDTDGITGTSGTTDGAAVTGAGATTGIRGVLGANELLGYNVENAADENLGGLEDAIISLENGCVDYMILSFGGILGLGDSHYIIPWRAVTIDPANGRLLLNIDPEVLDNAPVFDVNNLPDMTTDMWDTDYRSFWDTIEIATGTAMDDMDNSLGATGALTGTDTMTGTSMMTDTAGTGSDMAMAGMDSPCGTGALAAGSEAATDATATETVTDTASAEGAEMTVATPRVMRLSEMLDYNVYNPAGEELGAIEDVMIDWRRDQLAYAVLSFGGFLGLGDKWFAIPLDQLVLDLVEQRFVFDIEPEVLENAPGFDPNNLPDTANETWDEEIRGYWQQNR
jgi:sporulation protein YlmC with PRC-barrel domain